MPFAPDEWLAANVALVDRLSRFVCRGSRMTAGDVDDFTGYVFLKLVDGDYAVLRKFEGRCQITSFLIVVIRRALSDFLARDRGKYRPSRKAQRLGSVAVELDALVRRDRLSIAEAVQSLQSRGFAVDRAEAERIAARLPAETSWPVVVPLDDAAPATLMMDDEERDATERLEEARRISATLRDAFAELPAEDQTLLRLHFAAGWAVADIARSTGADQQRLYARLRRLCKTFRGRLLAAGIDAGSLNALLGRSDVDLDFGLGEPQISAAQPSSQVDDGVAAEKTGR